MDTSRIQKWIQDFSDGNLANIPDYGLIEHITETEIKYIHDFIKKSPDDSVTHLITGIVYKFGYGVDIDTTRFVEYLLSAASNNNYVAMFLLIMHFSITTEEENKHKNKILKYYETIVNNDTDFFQRNALTIVRQIKSASFLKPMIEKKYTKKDFCKNLFYSIFTLFGYSAEYIEHETVENITTVFDQYHLFARKYTDKHVCDAMRDELAKMNRIPINVFDCAIEFQETLVTMEERERQEKEKQKMPEQMQIDKK